MSEVDSDSDVSSDGIDEDFFLHTLVRDLIHQDRPRLDDHPMNVDWKIYEEILPLILLKVHQCR
jgi:hypothetical protein